MLVINTKDAIDRIGDEDIYYEIAQAFASHIPGYLMQIVNLLQADDMAAASRIIHSVKSNCATVGADALRERFAALEKITMQGRKREAIEFIEALRPDLLELKATLENFL